MKSINDMTLYDLKEQKYRLQKRELQLRINGESMLADSFGNTIRIVNEWIEYMTDKPIWDMVSRSN